MFIVGIICLIFSLFFFGYTVWLSTQRHTINHNIDKQNKELKEKNEQLKLENVRLNEEAARRLGELANMTEQQRLIIEQTEKENNKAQKAFENYCDTLDLFYSVKENEHDMRMKSLQSDFESKTKELQRESHAALEKYADTLDYCYQEEEVEFDRAVKKLKEELNEYKNELDKIRSSYAAVKEAKIREEEMILQADFYSLHLTQLEQDTISLIEELKPRLPDPRVLCMLIWTTFYQKQMSTLCNNVLGSNPICGIYKITNKKSGLCYIGQATNVADRFKQHAKCGLGIDTPAQNKLYKAMMKDGLINFTFELLEKCPREQLNEKEKYYISLYQSYDYGYNSTIGNK